MTQPPVTLSLAYGAPYIWQDRGVERMGHLRKSVLVTIRSLPEGAMQAAEDATGRSEWDRFLPPDRRYFEGATWRRPTWYEDDMSREEWTRLFDWQLTMPELTLILEDGTTGRRGRDHRSAAPDGAYARMVETYEAQAEARARLFSDRYVVCDPDGPWVREDWPYNWVATGDEDNPLQTMNYALAMFHKLRKPDAETKRLAGLVRRLLARGSVADLDDEEYREGALVVGDLCQALRRQGFTRGRKRGHMAELHTLAIQQGESLRPEVPGEDVDALAAAFRP